MPSRRKRRVLPPRPRFAPEALERRTLFAFPSITELSVPSSLYEGRTATVSGRFTDADARPEAHTVRFDWGDDSPPTFQDLPAGFTYFNASHVYTDDLPDVSGDADRREVRVTVTDALGATATATRTIRLLNIEPSVTLPNFVRGLEGAASTITPDVYDAGADALTYAWRVSRAGEVLFESAEHDLVFTPPDNGAYDVALTVTDDDGGATTRTSTIFAYNVGPTLSMAGGTSAVDEGAPYTLTLSSSDPGTDTIAQWTIDWGDGQVQTVEGNPPAVTHAYAGPGKYTIRATATDEDGHYGAPPLGVAFAAGDADASFGAGGRAMIDFPNGGKVAGRDAVAYPDGRVLVLASHGEHDTNDHTSLIRLNPDGSFDGTFSGDGRVYDPRAIATGGTLALQPDGRIVVAGVTHKHVVARRYNADGSRDETFGAGGEARVSLPLTITGVLDAAMHDVLALPGGKVLVAGRVGNNATAIALNPDGTPDATFGGGDGALDFPLPANTRTTTFYAAALAPDGRVALAGERFDSGLRHDVYVAVLRPDGTPDSSFDGDGVSITMVSHPDYSVNTNRDGTAFAAAFQPDGKLVVGGESSYQVWPLLRYRSDGTLDPTFGGDGVAQPAWAVWDHARIASLMILPDGKILSAGVGDADPSTSDRALALTRHNPDGTLDASFGTNGTALFGITPSWSLALPVAAAVLAADGGKVVVAGTWNEKVMLARFDADGSPDVSFGDGGALTESRLAANLGGTAHAVLRLPDGKILAVDQTNPYWNGVRLARFHPDGSVDTTFGDFGRVAASGVGTIKAVKLAPGGKILIAGGSAVSRFNPDGSPDATFGDNGVVLAALGVSDSFGAGAVEVWDVEADAHGRVLVAGSDRGVLRVARFNLDGTLDLSFGEGGLFKGYGDMWSVNALTLQPDGRVLVGTGGLVRLTAGGTPDPTFGGGDGVAPIPQPSEAPDHPQARLNFVRDILVRPDGRILAVGNNSARGGSAGGFEIAAFLPDGSPDDTFGGGDGRVSAGVGSAARQVALDPKGRILVGGFGNDLGTTEVPRYAVARFAPDGAIDYAFGRDGLASAFTNSHGDFHAAAAMAVLDNGDVLIGGSENETVYGRLVVTRVHADHESQLTVEVANLPPTADAGADRTAGALLPVTLTGAFSDPGGGVDVETVRWVVKDPRRVVVAEGEEPTITFTPAIAGRYVATFTVTDEGGAAASDDVLVDVTPRVVARHVFYDNSALDGRDPGPNPADDEAIAADKQPLLPGAAGTFANVTSYGRGINGIMFDVAGGMPMTALAGIAGSVGLRAGTGADPAGWAEAPRPDQIGIRPGAGAGGSDRVTLTWLGDAVRNAWLQVTVHAPAQYELPTDVFYFGNLAGETGDRGAALAVNGTDLALTRAYFGKKTDAALRAYDFNRDGAINAVDLVLVRQNQRRGLPALVAWPDAAEPVVAPVAPSAAAPLATRRPLRARPARRDMLTEPTADGLI